jgi:hypothetical protein
MTKIRSITKIPPTTASGTVIYADTDSVYIDFGKIFDTIGFDYKNRSPDTVKNYIIYNEEKSNEDMGIHEDMSDEEIRHFSNIEEESDSLQNYVSNLINKSMVDLTTKYLNCNKNMIFFKREAVAQVGMFIERKRYVLWVLNNEGVEVKEKKRLKVTGIDIVRSNVPVFVREALKEVVRDVLVKQDERYTIEQIREIHEKFFDASPEEIAFKKTANNITKFDNRRKALGDFKSTPQQVRGSILYNDLIKSDPSLMRLYDLIYDGDKMCYVYSVPSPMWNHDVFAFKDHWVKDKDFEQIIDRRRQFDVAMLNPMRKFFDLLHWSMPDFENADISVFFDW